MHNEFHDCSKFIITERDDSQSSKSMGQDPNFHIPVPSGWAELDNVFHVAYAQRII